MAKGDIIQLKFQDFTDSDTGARVTRLTPVDVTCHRNYFYQKCFTNDGKKLLFGALFDNGSWNSYLLDLETQQARQLTEGKGKVDNTFGNFLSPDDKYLYYVKGGRELRRVALDSLEEEVLYTVPQGYKGYGTWVANSACTKLVGIEVVEGDLLPLKTWEEFAVQFHKKPRCRLVKIDIATGTSTVIYEQAKWMGHPLYRPFDDNTVAYCHEGPHDLVDARMWFVNEDGTNVRCVKEHEEGEACTHEFFTPDGSKMLYVSYKKGSSDRWICSADPVTLKNEELLTMPPCSHLYSNYDGSLAVGDGCDTPPDVQDTAAHTHENDPFLYLFDLKNKTTKQICKHSTSWKVYKEDRQVTHPHPSFTPDDKRVLFTSDFEGEPALYLADLPV
ncbi:oligogalacturonate lyase family protein [Viridibacterium curvum]|uniref:Oligogalacturonate lyase n=1 Tax=Viridibacterium curvum TaxID=1101404 RepID=A0ABP9R9Q9_9RHOO